MSKRAILCTRSCCPLSAALSLFLLQEDVAITVLCLQHSVTPISVSDEATSKRAILITHSVLVPLLAANLYFRLKIYVAVTALYLLHCVTPARVSNEAMSKLAAFYCCSVSTAKCHAGEACGL